MRKPINNHPLAKLLKGDLLFMLILRMKYTFLPYLQRKCRENPLFHYSLKNGITVKIYRFP